VKQARTNAAAHRALATVSGLIRAQVKPPSTEELEYGLRDLFSRLPAESRRQRRIWWRRSLAGLGTAMALGALALFLARARPRPGAPAAPSLAYQLQRGTQNAGGNQREAGGQGVKLSFSEGTEFVLMPGTHGRLRSVGPAGARIAIEQGTAYFQVTPNTGRTWLVDVGPFLVTVKGTVFTVSWDPLRERFELRLRRGRVVVSGPVSGGDIVLREGQRLTVDLPRAETLISQDAGGDRDLLPGPGEAPRIAATAATAATVLAGAQRATTAAPATGRAVAAPPSGRPAHAPHPVRWDLALASGDWDAILADVDRRGVQDVLEGATSDELFALADAARYRRRLDLAREALLAQRRRFTGSARAVDAAFLLGRVEEAGGRGAERALRWYEEYLSRAPAGTYASEALGRRMNLIKDREGNAQARPIAEEYLRRFPEGTYAGSARALLH